MNTVERIVQIVGNQSELARRLNIKPQAIQKWVTTGQVPVNRVLEVEKIVEGQITRYEIRPDIYPKDASFEAAHG